MPRPYMTGYGVQHYLPAEQALEEAIKEGSTHFYVDGGYAYNAVDSWTPTRLTEFKKRLADTGVIPAFHSDFHQPVTIQTPLVRHVVVEYLYQEIDLAAVLGAPLYFVHAGALVSTVHPKQGVERALNTFTEVYQELRDYGQKCGVRVLVENLSGYRKFHPFYYVCTSRDDFRHLTHEVPEVEFILDIGHAHVHGSDPVGMFREFHDRIVAMSMSDNNGEADSHSRLGAGCIDLAGVIKAIRETGWQGYVFFETRGAGLQEGMDYLSQLELPTTM